MTLDDFIEALYKAGWTAFSDAQHAKIADLHKKLFPEIARLDSELQDSKSELYDKNIQL